MSEEKELIVVKEADIPALFKAGGCDPLLKRLHEELDKFTPDISTATGRKEIASFANKFARAKTLIDGHGKALVEEEKARLRIVDAERKKFRDECDEMKRLARKPLTDWEDAERERVAGIERRIALFDDMKNEEIYDLKTSAEVANVLENLKAHTIDESYEEFELAATKARESAKLHLEAKFIVLQNQEKEKAEAERLEIERLEKEREEREKKIAQEAAAKAKREAEEKAQEEKDRLEKEKLEAQLAVEKAEREKREAAERAEREKEEAVKAEQERAARQAEEERKAEEKRQANKRHQGKINRAAKESLIAEGVEDAEAERIIKLIIQGKIANVTINY